MKVFKVAFDNPTTNSVQLQKPSFKKDSIITKEVMSFPMIDNTEQLHE